MTTPITRDQALVNNLIAQREAASNQAANLAAELDVLKAENETLKTRIVDLEKNLDDATRRAALNEGFASERASPVAQ